MMICPQEKGYTTDSTHVHFTDGVQMAELARRLGLDVEKNYSFPFPRVAGRFFPYNEFCLVARKPAGRDAPRDLAAHARAPPHRSDISSAVPKQQPEQQAPPVQRLRVRYAKRGRLRFTSHRDFSRAFERAVFRARVPMAYSSGFNPHPRISYAGAAPTGSASEAEYLELALAQVVVPADVHAMLDEALPPGLDVLEVVESPGGSLSDLLEGSRWRIVLTVDREVAEDAVTRFLAADEALVERMTKKGMREFDARGAVVALALVAPVEGDGRAYDARRRAAARHAGRAPRRRPARPGDRGRARRGRGAADDTAGAGAAPRVRRGRRPAGTSHIGRRGRGVCDTRSVRRPGDRSGSVEPTTFSPATP